MNRFAIILIGALIACKQPGLTGKWKLEKVEISAADVNYPKNGNRVFDFTDRQQVKQLMIADKLTVADSIVVLKMVDSVLQKFEGFGIELRADSGFTMIDCRAFDPMLYSECMGSSIEGKWQLTDDTLQLRMNMMRNNFPEQITVLYKVLQLDNKQWQLQEVGVAEARRRVAGADHPYRYAGTIFTFSKK